MSRFRSTVAWWRQVLAWLAILGISAVVVVSVLVPRIAGATPYTVMSGSMRPQLPPGTIVVTRPVAPDRVRIGDVVTYQLRSGEPAVVTHRVVAVGVDGDGERVFRTQGDANEIADAAWVRPMQLKGVLWYDVPHLGRFTNVLNGDHRAVVLTAVIGLLLLYAVTMFAADARDRRNRRRPQPAVSHG